MKDTTQKIRLSIAANLFSCATRRFNPNKFYTFLRDELDVLFIDDKNMYGVRSEYIRLGYFQREYVEKYDYAVIYISFAGMNWLYNKFIEYDYLPTISLFDWKQNCAEIQEKYD